MATSETPNQDYVAHDPDVRLMLRVREGDAAAFEELVLRYQNRLVTVLEQLMSHRELAEDLAQDVFLRVYRARATYQPTAKFCTWLFTIANNVAKNAKRSQAQRREVHIVSRPDDDRPSGLENIAQAASGLMPTRQLDRSERAEMVREAVQALDDRQRMALLLSKFEGLNYEEIAAAMETTTKAVKSLLFRARENVRERLEPYMTEGLRPTSSVNET